MHKSCAVGLFGLLAVGCGRDRLGRSEDDLYVDRNAVVFEDTFVGFSHAETIRLHNGGKSRKSVRVTVEGEFSAGDSELVLLEGGEDRGVTVSFLPTAPGSAQGVLRLATAEQSLEVALEGVGLEVPSCVAADECHRSTFDEALGNCVESTAEDATPCNSGDHCLVDSQCFSGRCVGTPRNCDDGNACTEDACAPESGCLNIDVSAQCPGSALPCQAAFCSPATGCGLGPSPDGALCGEADCVTAHVCLGGSCQVVNVPEGFECAPETPCQGKGICRSQVCERPAATELVPAWSVTSSPGMMLYFPGVADDSGNLYWAECSPTLCELVSVTRDGFGRWRTSLGSRSGADLHTPGNLLVAMGLVVTATAEKVEAHREANGALVWRLDMTADLKAKFGAGLSGVFHRGMAFNGKGALFVAPTATVSLGCTLEWKGALYSIDVLNGAVLSSQELNGMQSSMVADEAGNVYVSQRSIDGTRAMQSFNALGLERWTVEPRAFAEPLAIWNGKLLDSIGAVRSLADGAILYDFQWQYSFDYTQGGVVPPVLGNTGGFAFASSTCLNGGCGRPYGEYLFRIDGTGNTPWYVPIPKGPTAMPQKFAPSSPLIVPILTQSDSILFVTGNDPGCLAEWGPEKMSLHEVGASGRVKFSCALPDYHLSGGAALAKERWTVSTDYSTVKSFEVKGAVPATQGWVGVRGGMGKAGRPQ